MLPPWQTLLTVFSNHSPVLQKYSQQIRQLSALLHIKTPLNTALTKTSLQAPRSLVPIPLAMFHSIIFPLWWLSVERKKEMLQKVFCILRGTRFLGKKNTNCRSTWVFFKINYRIAVFWPDSLIFSSMQVKIFPVPLIDARCLCVLQHWRKYTWLVSPCGGNVGSRWWTNVWFCC